MQTNKLIFGLCLIAVGVTAFLGAIDVVQVRHIGRLWPLILIAIGTAGEVEALRRRKSDGSYVLLAVGCWMLVGMLRLFDLSIGGAMPIGVMVAGLFVIVHALVDRPEVKREENDHVC